MPGIDGMGSVHEADLGSARIRYRDLGEGPPVVFVHGLLVNGLLWRKVAPAVADAGYRCLVPDWPLGSHEIPVPHADLSPPGVAALIARFLDVLDLTDVTVVANDTGGALSQILMANHPERLGRVVLTPSDSFERFFPPAFAALPRLARIPGADRVMTQALRARRLLRATGLGWVAKHPIRDDILDAYLLRCRRDPAIRHDLRRFLVGVHRRHTLAAAERLRGFPQPVLLAWAPEDKHFPMSLAHRLATTLPNAHLRTIADSYTFVPEDQPQQLTGLLVEFLRAHATT
ncbi:alpha/beta fold hydrolase [Prauserella muralis]|uniref:Alpha/beta hydrolase n=1 Tax=Prauserella muralis TaxID=588067 RepID=A0A2V4BK42_9PSEU|nr:alpha/beta hydrolase [Prauserella muralis]PXY31063.1 alpha/beta hydrolase [Prauserella muralis]TWE14658.1 pimeloyl-ACP methyl ester carboxylesterase [Prauserella muralis]